MTTPTLTLSIQHLAEEFEQAESEGLTPSQKHKKQTRLMEKIKELVRERKAIESKYKRP